MSHYTIHHALNLSRHWLMIFVIQQNLKMCVSFWGYSARPSLLQIIMLNLDRNHLFFFSTKGHSLGQRSEGVGLVAKEESTNRANPLVLIGVCKLLICWVWQAWERRSLGRLHYHKQTRSKGWWVKGCIEHATTRSFKAKIKSREH